MDLKAGREGKAWSQDKAARKLGVSQPYLSLLERGTRRVPEKLAHTAASVYGLSPTTLPVETSWHTVEPKDNKALAADLAALGYPGLSYLKSRRKRNPAQALLSALRNENLESRLAEALPWVLLEYPDLDWQRLLRAAKVHDLQNKLGFLTNVARRLAERTGRNDTASLLREKETTLEKSRLVRENTLCHDLMTEAERRWLRSNRPKEARHWNLLTDLSPEHLIHAV
jgi:transcriptional regulator with XRE-family HTH domain